MLTKDYKRIAMDADKLSILKSKFVSFFDQQNPSMLSIHVKPELFFDVEKSFKSSSIDPNKGNMQRMKQAPEPEEIQLQAKALDENGTLCLYAFSTAMPTPLDALGIGYEFGYGSGNLKRIGHNTNLIPRQDDELLYFLYFYCDLFENGHESVPKTGKEKYSFFVPEVQQSILKTTKVKEAKIITEVSGYDSDELKRVLTGIFAPVSKDESTNFNTLVEYLMKASEDQLSVYESVKKSVRSPKIDLGGSAEPVAPEGGIEIENKVISEYIQEWIDNGKLVLITEPDDYYTKKGWYQKPAKDDVNAEDKFLKTPLLVKIVDGVLDQRIALADHLAVNTELFDKLKKRW